MRTQGDLDKLALLHDVLEIDQTQEPFHGAVRAVADHVQMKLKVVDRALSDEKFDIVRQHMSMFDELQPRHKLHEYVRNIAGVSLKTLMREKNVCAEKALATLQDKLGSSLGKDDFDVAGETLGKIREWEGNLSKWSATASKQPPHDDAVVEARP